MNIEPNQHIKCIFRNGTIIEGIVQSWSKEESILLSLNDNSLMVILHPEEDVMLIKVLADKPEEPGEEKDALPLKEEIVAKLEEIRTEEDTDLQGKSIVELRQLVKAQEKQIIANKIREHFPSHAPRRSNYSSQVDLLPGRRSR